MARVDKILELIDEGLLEHPGQDSPELSHEAFMRWLRAVEEGAPRTELRRAELALMAALEGAYGS